MKILTKKEQLRSRLNELTELIDFIEKEQNKIYNRKQRKMNWGIFSFISEEYWLLDYKYKTKSTELKVIKEYQNLISDMLIQENNLIEKSK